MSNPATNGPLLNQQVIIYNAQVDLTLWETRQRDIRDKKIADQYKISPYISTGGRDVADLLHFRPYEPAFFFAHKGETTSIEAFVEQRVLLIQSLNGFVVPDDVKSDEQLNDLFVYAGQPNRSYFFAQSGQMPTGLAVVVAGSTPELWNYGWDEWFPGDTLMYDMGSRIPEVREREKQTLPHDREHPMLRDRARIKRLTYDRAYLWPQAELTASFDDNKKDMYEISRLDPNTHDSPTSAESHVIALRGFVSLVAFNTIMMLINYDVNPAANNNRLDNYSQDPQKEELLLHELLGRACNSSGEDNMFGTLAHSAADEATNHSRKAELAKFWAAKLGLLQTREASGKKPWYNFRDQIVGMSLRPLLTTKEYKDFFSVANLFPVNQRASAFVTVDDVSRSINKADTVGALLHAQSDIPRRMYSTLGLAAEKIRSRRIGTSLTHTRPGQPGAIYK